MNCPHCQATVLRKSKFCHECGRSVRRKKRRRAAESRMARRSELAESDEQLLWQASFSAKGLIHAWLLALVSSILLPLGALLLRADSSQWLLLVAFLGLVWAGLGAWLLIRRLNVHYELSDQRLIHRSGILLRKTHRIELIDIDDVAHEQDLIERFFDVGTIEIVSSDRSHPIIELPGIDGIEHVAMLIDDARRRERIRRGIHIEQV